MKLEPYKDWSDRVGEEFYYTRIGRVDSVVRLRLVNIEYSKIIPDVQLLRLVPVEYQVDGLESVGIPIKIAIAIASRLVPV